MKDLKEMNFEEILEVKNNIDKVLEEKGKNLIPKFEKEITELLRKYAKFGLVIFDEDYDFVTNGKSFNIQYNAEIAETILEYFYED